MPRWDPELQNMRDWDTLKLLWAELRATRKQAQTLPPLCLPEYVTALTATIKGHQELSVGNIIGADILDIFWVLGGCSLMRPLKLNPDPPFLGFPQTQSLDLPIMFLLMILLIGFGFSKGELKRWQGGVLFLIYVVYLFVLFAVVKPPM